MGLLANHGAELLYRSYCAPYTARVITLLFFSWVQRARAAVHASARVTDAGFLAGRLGRWSGHWHHDAWDWESPSVQYPTP